MKRLISEPLIQFIGLGFLLYFLINFISPSQMSVDSQKDIVVDDGALKEYVQFQRKSFDADSASTLLSSMSDEEKQILIDNFVRDEALYREALSMGLNSNDEIIRRRLIQKMEYIAQGFYDDIPTLTEKDLRVFFNENSDLYRIDSSITFTHVFVSLQENGPESSKEQTLRVAKNMLLELNKNGVRFDQAGRHGDRFLYNLNYVERTPSYVASHFGEQFEKTLFGLAVSDQWQGPIRSQYGWHLVMLKDKTISRDPDLEEVAQIVLADAQRDQRRKIKLKAIKELVDKYNVQHIKPRSEKAIN